MVSVYQATLESAKGDSKVSAVGDDEDIKSSGQLTAQKPLSPMASRKRNVDRDYQNLLQLMEEAIMSRDANRTNLVVGGLVQHIVGSWREQFCRSVTTKFNCYFMLPFVDEFHRYIRNELHKAYDGEAGTASDVFDLASVRRSLESHRVELENECLANKRLQEKFQLCAKLMNTKQESVFDKPSR
jgi:hypothetical protein